MTLAQHFNGEVINSDVLQMYEGLPIATNKLSLLERKDIPHHLLGCISLQDKPWVVSKFISEADKTIEDVRARGRLPILAGGTHYYLQSLLLRGSVLSKVEAHTSSEEQERKWPILTASGEEMLDELRKIDPDMARKWHPRDGRRIRRSLEIWLQTGRRASDIYREQKVERDQSLQGNPESKAAPIASDLGHAALDSDDIFRSSLESLRYDTLFLWIHADSETLKQRLNERVNRMIDEGLLDEVKSMSALRLESTAQGKHIDITKGIWTAIGFKEFEEYTLALDGEIQVRDLEKIKADGVEKAKAATRRYAKRQVRWNRLKLLSILQATGSRNKLFLLDGSDLSKWSTDVEEKACVLTEAFLSKQKLPIPSSLSNAASLILAENIPQEGGVYARVCETCDTTLMTENDWGLHLKSKKHQGLVKRTQHGLEKKPGGTAKDLEGEVNQ